MLSRLIPCCLAAGFALLCLPLPALAQLDLERLSGMEARSIGPAGMSGRVTAFDVVLRDPNIIYAGTASGGLWKSTSGGVAWEPVFDDQPVASIGSVAVDPRNPDVVWVGTGEGNPRNSQTNGNGVYKSIDGGRTWTHLGLDNTRNIHRLLIHPEQTNTVYVGVQGAAWGEHPERGVYKTTDGGATWEQVLSVGPSTGIADLIMDPANPDKLFAAMWEFRRWPWFFESGGPGSGLYVTFDGGATWTERTSEDGLPKGELGRLGLAIAPSNPNRVYALVESKENGLYRSEDGGFTWAKIADADVSNRPFYYHELYVDPKNENRVYNIHSIVEVSEDGGKTFETLVPYAKVHPDHHAWWIHPDDPNFMLDGNDGGMAITHDRGKTWRFVENLPLAQFYHINVDMATPYNVCGGLQDNGSWCGPSQVWRAGGIRNAYWEEVAFGDGFDVVPDLEDPRYVYAMSQGGNLRRRDLVSGEEKFIRPPHPDDVYLRYNWNAAIAADPLDPPTIYYGSQFLHKSTDRGDSWTILSPDLTTNDPEKQRQLDSGGLTYDVTQAENFTTIVAIAPSPVEQGIIWVGTDDGNVQLTRDGGETWTNVVANIPDVAEGSWVPQIQASTYDAGTAFVVFDDHRRNNWTPYVYRTTDFGETWTRIVDEDDVFGFALAVVQDPVEPNLLFLGTEFGLYVSVDGAETWTKWTNGMPTVSVMDLVIHPRDHDLVMGTFGRAVYILDDIRPLRALAQEGTDLLAAPLHAFDVPDAVLSVYAQATGTRFSADAIFAGENRPYGALLSYVVTPPDTAAAGAETATASAPSAAADSVAADSSLADSSLADSSGGGDKVKIEILDEAGTVIRTLMAPAEPGLNRFAWELDRKGVRSPSQPKPERADAPEPGGPEVLPGTYTARFTYGEHEASTTIDVRLDPRLDVSMTDLQARNDLLMQVMDHTALATEAADRLRDAGSTVDAVAERLADREDEAAKTAVEKGRAAKDSIKTLLETINGQDDVQGIRRDPNTVSARLFQARNYVGSAFTAPGDTEQLVVAQAEGRLGDMLAEVNAFFEDEWTAYREAVDAADVSFFEAHEPLRMSALER